MLPTASDCFRWLPIASDCFLTCLVHIGPPQYAPSFAVNLSGGALPSLVIGMLAQLGVSSHDDQKRVMQAVRGF